jgi:hypothetical protein
MTPKDAILDLVSKGWTEAGIANAVGTSQPNINRIKAGKQGTNFALGAALIALSSMSPKAKAA